MNRAIIPAPIVHHLILLILLLPAPALQAQNLQVTNATTAPLTPENLISNIFLGAGVKVTNISFNGKPAAAGYFSGGLQAVGLERGILLTTGLVETSNPLLLQYGSNENGKVLANNSLGGVFPETDPDLGPLAGKDLHDIASFVISFIPDSDTLRFRYCFASEEYPDYSCSGFNDIFGFFIQGPGYPTPTNIALIPGTGLPVAINNIHPGFTQAGQPCPEKNIQYYIDNSDSNKQPSYNGLTTVFTAQAVVQPCETYTIKLAIADAGDGSYDSGVFLEAKSFGTESLRIDLVTPSSDGFLSEGCAGGTLKLRLPAPALQDFPIDFSLFGTATNGIDYLYIPPVLVIPAGQQEIGIPLLALEDNLADPDEFLALDIWQDACHRDTIRIFLRENTMMAPDQLKDTSYCIGDSPLLLNGYVPVQLPQPLVFNNDQDINIQPLNTPVLSTVQVSGVFPANLQAGMVRSVCLDVDHGWVDDLDVYLISPGGQFLELMTDCGSNGKNIAGACFSPYAIQKIGQANALAAPFSGEWLPEGSWNDLWPGTNNPANGVWQLQLKDDQAGFAGTLRDWSISFLPRYEVQYQWSPASGLSCTDCPSPEASPAGSTIYTVRAIDSYGCAVQDSATVQVNLPLEAPTVSCAGYTNTSISFAWPPVGGASGYEVNVNGGGWTPANGVLSHQVGNLGPGTTVSIQVRGIGLNNAGCSPLAGTLTCSNCQQPVPTITVKNETCAGAGNGAVILTTDNANPPYTFHLDTATNLTGVFANLTDGEYWATVTDHSGCQILLPVILDGPDPLEIEIAPGSITCFGGDNGTAAAMVSGGTGQYNFHWNDITGQTTQQAVNLKAGAYTVTATDTNGCSATASVTLTQPSDIALNISSGPVKCYGDSNGVALASAGGGAGPYQYFWSNGQTGATAANLKAGNYLVTVTDATGCAKTSFALIGEPPPITLSTNVTNAGCQGSNTGAIAVSAQGGSGTLAYKWNDPAAQSTAKAGNLSAGIYTVTVTDQNGCTVTQTAAVAAPPALQLIVSGYNVSCNGDSTGSATVTATGGTGNFTYHWSDPAHQSTASAILLPAGTYTVTATDANGCAASASATLSEPPPLVITASTLPTSCPGAGDGRVELHVSGGVLPYLFKWNSGETTAAISNLTAGAYTVTVTDGNGCVATQSATVAQPAAFTTNIVAQHIRCFGGRDGVLQINFSGNNGPFLVNWSGPGGFYANGPALAGLSAGVYSATVSDATGCAKILTVTIDQPMAPLVPSLPAVGDTICYGANNGAAEVSATGGTPPYAYFWNTGNQTGAKATGLASTIHRVTITDANNCTAIDSIYIPQQQPVSALVRSGTVDCFGSADGTASVIAVLYGSTPADPTSFSYLWSTVPPQHSIQASGLKAGLTYTVTVSDHLGCSATQTATIGNARPLGITIAETQNPKCNGSNEGRIIAAGAGGTMPYTYIWGPNVPDFKDSMAQNLPAGTYRIIVTDSKGCTAALDATLHEPPPLKIRFESTGVLCFGATGGRAKAIGEGGTPAYQFAWSDGTQGAVIQNKTAGVYAVAMTDANSCAIKGQVAIRQPDSLSGGTVSKRDAGCFGSYTGEIQIHPTGGTPPYRYALNNGALNGSSKQIGLAAGVYSPRVQDKNGCVAELPPVEITQMPEIKIDLGPALTIDLGSKTQLFAAVSNAAQPVEFFWNPDDSRWLNCLDCPDPIVDSLFYANWFDLEVTDAAGCAAQGRVLVQVDKTRNVFVPEAFTPNHDGTNDVLLAHGQESTRVVSFQVFDRWGEKLYQGGDFLLNDPNNGWDGSFRGQPASPGVYVWVLEVEYRDGAREIFHGSTTLLQ